MFDHHGSDFGWSLVRSMPPGAALMKALADADFTSLEPAALVDAAAAAKRLRIAAEALELAAGEALWTRMQADDPERYGDPTTDPTRWAAREVAAALAETRHRSATRLWLARRLKHELPSVWALVRQGRLDLYQAELILTELGSLTDPDLRPRLEQRIIDRMVHVTPGDAARANPFGLIGVNPTSTRRIVRRVMAAAQPQAVDDAFRQAYGQRRVSTGPGDAPGMAWLSVSHLVDRITGIQHRLGLLARALPADDPRTMDQKVADLAADLLEGRLICDTPTSRLEEGDRARFRLGRTRRRIQINIAVPVQTAMGLSDTPGETLAGDVIPASLARQLAADSDSVWYRLLTDRGRFVELSTHTYTPTRPQHRAIEVRDRRCIGVGCQHPADTCDTDHTLAWSHGGSTREGNLGASCRADHRAKDNAGPCRLMQPEPGVFRWSFPSGHTYTTRGDPYPEAAWPTEPTVPPASARDLAEGLHLLESKRRREITRATRRRRQTIAEQRLHTWLRHEPPDPAHDREHAGIDHWAGLPAHVLDEILG